MMKLLWNRLRIWHYKRKLRAAHLAYWWEFDRRKGGHYIVQMTSPRMHRLALTIDALLVTLKRIDPEARSISDIKLAAF